MKETILVLIIFYFSSLFCYSIQEVPDINKFINDFTRFNNSGDFVQAEKCLYQILELKGKISNRYEVYCYANLGVISSSQGNYKKALDYYNLAEKSIYNKADSDVYLVDIYVNKGIIFGYQKSYSDAIDYFEKGIRIYRSMMNPEIRIKQNLSAALLNLGIILFEIGDFDNALENLMASRSLKSKYKLPEKAFVELNIAKTFVKLSKFIEAERCFIESIESLQKEFGPDYYRVPEVYFEYGQLLSSLKKYSESLEIFTKANSICLRNYGEKHTLTSWSYKLIGDFYFNRKDYQKALDYYQQSLISITNGFDNRDIFTNPPIDSSLFDLRLLDNLKCKSAALGMFAYSRTDPAERLKCLSSGLETVELALKVIAKIRSGYPTEESRIYLAENEKNTYFSAVKLAESIFTITGNDQMMNKMYALASEAKAAVLRNEITGNELLYSAALPDSILQRQKALTAGIAAYGRMINEENLKEQPDSALISLWKDAVFDMNRKSENINSEINIRYPRYRTLLEKTEALPLKVIQRQMSKNETIIDYYLSVTDSTGMRDLYIFLISRDKLTFHVSKLDSLFNLKAGLIHSLNQNAAGQITKFREYTGALCYMYESLIKHVEQQFIGENIIIIPDEEIAWLPFDAFLSTLPEPVNSDYENLDFLLKRYAISYGYSSSLISGNYNRRFNKVISFLPDYSQSDTHLEELRGAGEEIESVYRLFTGEKYDRERATEANFMSVLDKPAILHLAMHSIYDTLNSRYSYLQFDTHSDTTTDGRLYNYEISLARIKSPMVVISACNSGAGKIYHGEGVMSIARGFILAGASSVIKTSWEVNDEAGAAIMKGFYKYLSKGMNKDEAMKRSKLDYLKGRSPAYTSPYYWAAYEVMGDNSPVGFNKLLLILPCIFLILAGGGAAFYFRRRRMFRADSL